MHILVDVRTTGPADLIRQNYGIAWVHLWKTYHPHDTITYLASPWSIIEWEVIYVRENWNILERRRIAHHQNGPDRIISFSRLVPIDRSIPTLSHIFDSVELLYPRWDHGIIGRTFKENQYNSLLKNSQSIIVPHLEVGMELVELSNIHEHKISVIPYFVPVRAHAPFSCLSPLGIIPGYWIVEGSSGDEWDPFWLLRAYSHYIHEFGGTKRLIITGDLWSNLRHISECIRWLNIMDYVKIVGILPEQDRIALYEYASGWIALGGYYGWGPTLAYALTYGLPIFTSDIAPIREYADITLHPNHSEEIVEKLLILSKLSTTVEKYIHSPHAIVEVYGRLIAEAKR